jgi:hypothetical protein
MQHPMADQNLKAKVNFVEANRRRYHLSISALCRAAKIARTTWHDWITGRNEPQRRTWTDVEAALPRRLRGELRREFP